VASRASGFVTGVADGSGNFTIYNVAAGSYQLNAYAAGYQYDTLTTDVAAQEKVTGLVFTASEGALPTVSGNVNIVNAPGGSLTSVVLIVEETFSDTFVRGEVPPGLRAGDVSGAFSIPNVPPGKYVVLAAFENDDLVRDPDPNIGGTQIVHIEVVSDDVALSESFKVTEALETQSPGAEQPEGVSAKPSFVFADDSSEQGYQVYVYNAFGEEVWKNEQIPGVSGDKWVTVAYEGPALEEGMYYQWRAVSIGKKGDPITTTEDLRGLFFLGTNK
jgi:hypothetical protein